MKKQKIGIVLGSVLIVSSLISVGFLMDNTIENLQKELSQIESDTVPIKREINEIETQLEKKKNELNEKTSIWWHTRCILSIEESKRGIEVDEETKNKCNTQSPTEE